MNEKLKEQAQYLRRRIVETVKRNGGHLASNLGVVELAVALADRFSPSEDRIIWDVGHQCYAWKLLTGRDDKFDTLRTSGGISGFPRREESPCDAFGTGHAGTAISAALGFAAARDLRGGKEHVVAIVGDGAFSNGISLEALNNVSSTTQRLIVILNDNEMSISESVGALSRYFGRVLASRHYNAAKLRMERVATRLHLSIFSRIYYKTKTTLKSLFVKNTTFENFGLRYVGPIDGHDFSALRSALSVAKTYTHPILIHILTKKGKGFAPAEEHPENWHSAPPPAHSAAEEVFAGIGKDDERVCAITAAMRQGTGLETFAKNFPARFFDVGISEGHAVTFAAGLAAAGMRPIVALYSTFAQRAVDNFLHDVCLQNLPVILCLDRAGIVGADGATHHGIYDIPLFSAMPNLRIMQARDAETLDSLLREALKVGGPCIIRYPRGLVKKLEKRNFENKKSAATMIVTLPDMETLAAEIAKEVGGNVISTCDIKPVNGEVLRAAEECGAKKIIVLENGVTRGGFGCAVREEFLRGGLECKVISVGWPDKVIPHGTDAFLKSQFGLTAEEVKKSAALNIS